MKSILDLFGNFKVSNLKLTIHKWGSVQEMKQLEYEMLTKVDAAKHKGYYNKHNGHPGVKEIDYIVGDIYSIPEKDFQNYTEKVLQLKNIWCCLSTSDIANITPSSLPALNNGYITFGCFNNLNKINKNLISTILTLKTIYGYIYKIILSAAKIADIKFSLISALIILLNKKFNSKLDKSLLRINFVIKSFKFI